MYRRRRETPSADGSASSPAISEPIISEALSNTRQEAGFAAATEPVDAEGIVSGSVVEQNSAADTEASAGTTVTLSVSTGPDVVTTPNVVGRTEPEAEATWWRSGLRSAA